ncbi:MAG: hypothetical protein KME55_40210 [Nostoc indistinguendum CM1-VF10]|jgi:hypothetical protein|nr:hypothetical protein [Nostoc indistinguendum CM1-VF10]
MRPQYNDRQSTLSTDSTPSNNLPQEKNAAIATITITAVEYPTDYSTYIGLDSQIPYY